MIIKSEGFRLDITMHLVSLWECYHKQLEHGCFRSYNCYSADTFGKKVENIVTYSTFIHLKKHLTRIVEYIIQLIFSSLTQQNA